MTQHRIATRHGLTGGSGTSACATRLRTFCVVTGTLVLPAWLGAVPLAHAQCDSSFTAAIDYGAGANPTSVGIGDFNGDGKPDLAVANDNSHNVSVLLGNGNGTFGTAINYEAGNR